MATVRASAFGAPTAALTPLGTDAAGLAFVVTEGTSDAVTWDGVSMTALGAQVSADYFGISLRAYRIEGIATGSSVNVTATGTGHQICYAVAIDGANQTNCVYDYESGGTGAFPYTTAPSVTVDAIVSQLLIGFLGTSPSSGTPTPGGTDVLTRTDARNGDYQSIQSAIAASTTPSLSWTITAAPGSFFGIAIAEPAGGPPAPGTPTITAAGSAEDAVRAILSALPADADDVEVYGSTTTGVDETDTLVGTLTGAGSVFWTGRTPDTTYYLRPRATGPGGETFGDEVTAATFDDDFADKGVDEAVLTDTLSLLEGETATHVDVPLGEMIRATSGLARTRSAVVVITDGDAETIGGDTFTGSDITNVDGGEVHRIALSPNPTGPQTITVTATVSIDPA